MLARFESKGLISHKDVRGTDPQIASKMLAQSRDREETDIHTHQGASPKILAEPLKKKLFEKPTPHQVSLYMTEIGVPNAEFESEGFIAYYESNGWRVGKNPMKSWKGSAQTWKHNLGRYGGNGDGRKKQGAAVPAIPGKYDNIPTLEVSNVHKV